MAKVDVNDQKASVGGGDQSVANTTAESKIAPVDANFVWVLC